jgi:hypothetical protein
MFISASALNGALSPDVVRIGIPATLAFAGLITGWLTTRRKNLREDREAALAALRKTRRFKAPRPYYDLDDDLDELRDALHPFPALAGHYAALSKVTLALWRDSHADWAESDGEGPFAGGYDADLAEVRDALSAAISRRIRAGALRRRWAQAHELRALQATVSDALSVDSSPVSRPKRDRIQIDPTGAIDTYEDLNLDKS